LNELTVLESIDVRQATETGCPKLAVLYSLNTATLEVCMSPRKLKIDPIIIEMPSQKMAVVQGKGPPDKVFAKIFPALYGSVYTLKFDLKKRGLESFKVNCPRARYPNAHLSPKGEWLIVAGIPIPGNTASLPQKEPDTEVRLETWEYGTVAQILHLGPYDQETKTIERLQQFINDNGYEIAGPHEEEYQSRPDAKVIKTLIRYQVKKKRQ
jgi:effector-binding domain-containing protein